MAEVEDIVAAVVKALGGADAVSADAGGASGAAGLAAMGLRRAAAEPQAAEAGVTELAGAIP